ncbi:low specificity L-threonine aldolase [Synechococcus sp. PCC 7336]|uniref:threonine aldolase family protein n=1 Tax=Synechococcus sp. PCC 7336 TaxID=195250 RepID=UPI00034CA621|nr:GntG family PLP-dependent aldolase [Synechococcus sp. PCC 7336]
MQKLGSGASYSDSSTQLSMTEIERRPRSTDPSSHTHCALWSDRHLRVLTQVHFDGDEIALTHPSTTPPVMATIDLRSDTITQPTPAMRLAIANAAVGDDVLGDDPTVKELEADVAQLLGKEAAVYMPSGTMTNQVAVRLHTQPGDEIVLESEAHIYYYESGAPAALSGVMCRLVSGRQGVFAADDLVNVLRSGNPHYPPTTLVCIENTHNRGGGTIFPLEAIQAIAEVCQQRGLAIHMDGARLWNACEATGITPTDYAEPFDTVSVCFSKGLGAPVGSALAGSSETIDRARRFRKMFGGAMRQAGTIAAGALYALQHHRDRLCEDRENAQLLARQLVEVDGIEVDLSTVQTNIVVFRCLDVPAPLLAQALGDRGVKLFARDRHSLRAVTSLMVTREHILQVKDKVADALTEVCAFKTATEEVIP